MPTHFSDGRCASIAFAAQTLGDKWNPIIIRVLSERKRRFSELLQQCGINPRTLSARLHDLELHQIISRTVYAEVPPRVEYELTDKGRDLIPILKKMADWGDKHRCGRNVNSRKPVEVVPL